MAYIDLIDDFPEHTGVYKVKIKSFKKEDRFCEATWLNNGFTPVNDSLKDDEYIEGWYNN